MKWLEDLQSDYLYTIHNLDLDRPLYIIHIQDEYTGLDLDYYLINEILLTLIQED